MSTLKELVDEAAQLQRNVNRNADDMARLIAGRLRSAEVYSSTLTKLKRELQGWNMHTNRWTDK